MTAPLLTDDYLKRVTSFFKNSTRYNAMLRMALQPFVDAQAFLDGLPAAFDLDYAQGVQLDVVGQWIGRSRYVYLPSPPPWFSLDIDGLGLDQAVWKGPYDPGSFLTVLDDDTYRRLLRAKIAANEWNGTVAAATAALVAYYDNPAVLPFIDDKGDGTCVFGLSGKIPDLVDMMVVEAGYIPFKPVGITTYYMVVSLDQSPMFGLDMENDYISGLDESSWGVDPSLMATDLNPPVLPTTAFEQAQATALLAVL